MMLRRLRGGFTLIELLVVIAIIAMLMGLLLPAVQSARETARGNTCRNRMRNIALAVYQYDQAKGRYPGIATNYRQGRQALGWRSLYYSITPQLERPDIYEFYYPGAGNGRPQFYVELLSCPSDPQFDFGTSYVYNRGYITDDRATIQGNTAAKRWKRANGIFNYDDANQTKYTPSSANYVSANDGLSNTLMISENLDANSWRMIARTENQLRIVFGWVDEDESTTKNQYRINAEKGLSNNGSADNNGNQTQYARPSSRHPQVVNVAFADAHCRTLNEDIAYLVYAELCCPKGSQAWNEEQSAAPQNISMNQRRQGRVFLGRDGSRKYYILDDEDVR